MPTAQPKSSTDCMKNLRLCRDQEPTLGPGPIRDILDLALNHPLHIFQGL